MTGALLAKTPMDAKLAEVIGPSAEGMGFRLVRVRLTSGQRPTLQIMAERADGTMNVDDCAELSRALSAILDVEDPIDREYVLEVSSPGIDRPLTAPEDFERFAGHEAKLETEEMIDGRKRFRGVLRGVDAAAADPTVLLDLADGGEARLPFSALADAKLVLTDALVAESLKLGGEAAQDVETGVDDIEFEGDDDAQAAETDRESDEDTKD